MLRHWGTRRISLLNAQNKNGKHVEPVSCQLVALDSIPGKMGPESMSFEYPAPVALSHIFFSATPIDIYIGIEKPIQDTFFVYRYYLSPF